MFNFTIVPDNGEQYQLVANARDVLKWERAKSTRSLALLTQDMHYADLYELAFNAAKRQRLFTGSLAEFEESHDVIPVEDDSDFPTQSAV